MSKWGINELWDDPVCVCVCALGVGLLYIVITLLFLLMTVIAAMMVVGWGGDLVVALGECCG